MEHDADARAKGNRAPGDRDRSAEAVEQSLGEPDGLMLGDVLEQERELVSTESRHGVARAHGAAESPCDLL